MKKNIIYLLIAGCSLFLGACNDDDTQYLPPVELQITSSTVDFKSVGGDGTIEVGNADPTLTATSNEEWWLYGFPFRRWELCRSLPLHYCTP